ncbi:MAG: RHS repeat protein, partial [Ignavibacteriae bacterium]|nr:RHS repeat protein [Ignavibacteriota bacterium]
MILFFSLSFFSGSCSIFNGNSGTSQLSVETGVTNVSNMFNERGFYKSNGFSFDEQEIINDFNGNLMLNFPLYNFSLAGDVNLNLSMNYNGSVGHQFFLNENLQSYELYTRRYSMNAPEWIISLNGIAIQTLNFETNFLTSQSSNDISGDSVKLLIPGYHFDNPLYPSIESPDNIMILAGDGSVINMVNTAGTLNYEGNYKYKGKDLHYTAEVKYIEDSFEGYTRRKVELMKGDGAIYEFVEYKRDFYDLRVNNNTVNVRRRPLMLLLEKVKDEFGHVVTISYDFNVPTEYESDKYGRPLVKKIEANGYSKDPIKINFVYGPATGMPSIGIQNTSEVNGNYKFVLKNSITLFNEYNNVSNHRGLVWYIETPLYQYDTLKYESYSRTFINIPKGNSLRANVTNTLNRLSYVRNTLNKKTEYTYTGNNNLELTYTDDNEILKSSGNNYKGYGRDLFYTNMLSSKKVYDNQTANSEEYFDYTFNANGTPEDKINASQIFESKSRFVNLNPLTSNNSEDSIYTRRSYKTFPINSFFESYLIEPDIEGSVKLMFEYSYYNPFNESSRFNHYNYGYDSGSFSNNIYSGSFLMTEKQNIANNNIYRNWNYSYEYKDGSFDSVITSMTETDPLLNKNRTTYNNFYKTGLIHKRMTNSLSELNSNAFNDTSIYYKIQVPKSQERLNQNSQVISKIDYNYIDVENDSYGYYGQLRNTKQYNDNSPFEFILTEFEYYKNDYSGNAVYTGDFYPYKEGNIKVTRSPNGEVTKFFYNPITSNEVKQPIGEFPELLFYLKYNNGVTIQTSENIWDGRFPIRTDSYREQSGTTDTLSITYKSYAIDGSPTKLISQNKYTTDINYEPIHRVSSIILPGDFTPDSSASTIKYDYDNVYNYIYILSYRNTATNDHSKIKYSIDGFGNVKQKDVFTSDTDSNSFRYNFNYMNILSDNTDAMNNNTQFSNDGLGRNIQTKYPDGSFTKNTYTYQNFLPNYFGGTYYGFIEFQNYTDETSHNFEKYFDAVGNLLKEVKYADEIPSFDIETIRMETDFYYDSLYRLIKVRTPENKYIFYSYDGYGRQSQRITPDAGQTKYVYDKNNNLTYSQDANQKNVHTDKYTFRNYDGINRLTGVGEDNFLPDSPTDGGQSVPSTPDLYLTVNVYDTLSSSVVNGLFFPPPGYYTGANNFTKGNLVSTAFRTRNTDDWSFKYYRYDERGRVIKMWNIIDGLSVKEVRYEYNSQDQITHAYYQYDSEFKGYSYYYDYAGRLYTLNYTNPNPSIDKSAIEINFTTYSYNPNSHISFQFFNSSELQNQYEYNSRNWITSMNSLQGLFGFTNTYFPNGNVKTQLLFGTYKDHYPQNNYNLNYNFTYDYSNRLLEAVNINQGDKSFSVYNTYDKDGNLTTLKRYGDNNIVTDDFNYQYYSGTNKLSKVSGAEDQYNYDLNGNVTRDTINYNFNIQYDHRNLITQLYHTDREAVSRPYTYATRYYYDESGSRVRKLEYFNTQTNPPLITDWNNPGNGWQ